MCQERGTCWISLSVSNTLKTAQSELWGRVMKNMFLMLHIFLCETCTRIFSPCRAVMCMLVLQTEKDRAESPVIWWHFAGCKGRRTSPVNVVQIQVSTSCGGALRASLLSWHTSSVQDIVKKLSSKIQRSGEADYVVHSIEKECAWSRSVSAEAVHLSASLPAQCSAWEVDDDLLLGEWKYSRLTEGEEQSHRAPGFCAQSSDYKRSMAATLLPPKFMLSVGRRKFKDSLYCYLLLFQLCVKTIVLMVGPWDPEKTIVDAGKKQGTDCTSDFDVAYVRQGEDAAQHWLLFLQLFAMEAAAGHCQLSCKSVQSNSSQKDYQATVHCREFKCCKRRG